MPQLLTNILILKHSDWVESKWNLSLPLFQPPYAYNTSSDYLRMVGEIVTLASGIFFFLTNVSVMHLYGSLIVSTLFPRLNSEPNWYCCCHHGNVSPAFCRLKTSSWRSVLEWSLYLLMDLFSCCSESLSSILLPPLPHMCCSSVCWLFFS